MPSLKAIRKRIASVQSTQKITKAMKMVSAAKLRRAQAAAFAARPYARKLTELVAGVVGGGGGSAEDAHPLLRVAESPARVRLVLVTSDRGLCGAYNAALLREAGAFVRAQTGFHVSLTLVGRKGVEHFRRRSVEIADRYVQISGPSIALAREISGKLTAEFARGEVDRVEVLYSAFRSALSQVPTRETLLPVSIVPGSEPAVADPLVEPDRSTLLDRLLPQFVGVRIYAALLEAAASEHGARMTAMDSATSNAAKMIFNLTLAMNRARQAAITKELMEIVSGAEALKG